MNRPLPDLPTAESWLAEQGVEGELLAHVRLVAAIAEHLARRLRDAGEDVDPELAHRGGLLHDLTKVSAQAAARSHEVLAAELLIERGQPELAEIARRHAMWAPLTAGGAPLTAGAAPETWEQKVVYYADRIAQHDTLVGIDARMLEIARRRPELRQRIDEYRAAALAQEAEIAARLGLSAAELWRELEREVRRPAS